MNKITRLIFRRLLLAALAWAGFCALSSIQCLPGGGENVAAGFANTRERDFHYHGNTDDQHWYGTDKWAVRFDFTEAYPTFDTSDFVFSKVKAYFPVVPSPAVSATITLYSETAGLPSAQLSEVTADITSHWMVFTLPTPQTVSVVWVVLNCATTLDGPYVSASIGGGGHSYYWNANAPVQYYQNMLAAGYQSEFLITAVGRFELSGTDLELSAFELKPQVAPNQDVQPEFTIHNNSGLAVDAAAIFLTVTSPEEIFTLQDTIFVQRQIGAHASLVVTVDDPDYQEYGFRLPASPLQLKVKAVLHSEYDPADTLFNNTLTRYYNSFNHDYPICLVENFVRLAAAENFIVSQSALLPGTCAAMNYFPLNGDSYYQPGATQRYNWYGFAGLPMTVAGGDSVIAGYLASSYADCFSSATAGVAGRKTFIQPSTADLQMPGSQNQLMVQIRLRNTDTHMFDAGADPALLRQSRFYAALCRRVPLYGQARYVFDRWGAYADTIGTALGIRQEWSKQFSFTVSDLGLDSLLTDYDLIFWIQHNITKQIVYSDLIPLSETVGNQDQHVPQATAELVLHPNPVRQGGKLGIGLAKQPDGPLRFRIYDVKGRLVSRGEVFLDQGKAALPLSGAGVSGLYLIRLQVPDAKAEGGFIKLTGKFLVME